jgi:peptidyl-dipeptidase Dcp
VLRLAALRAQKAKLLGFLDFATWKLQDQMAETPEAVNRFFAQLTPAATAKAKAEAADIQAVIEAQKSGFTLQPWDWNYYAEQVRKAKFDLDESEVKPYFELNNVLENGVFYAANQLYGLTFKERRDIPVYQEDVRVFEVFDKDGKAFALFYSDNFKRDNKRGGAWCWGYTQPSKLLGQKPTVYNVMNAPKPAPGQPALVSFDDVRTLFHEFGHALHALFGNQQYPSLGSDIARDFVEFPSQLNEHWALHPKILKHYAVHYKTGETIPQALVDKIKKASAFNTGYKLTEQIAASLLDLEWHKLSDSAAVTDVAAFEKAALQRAGIDLPQVPPRYRSSYFSHIWSSESYAGGYYGYQWTKMLSEDAYAWFEENGGLTRANGQRFRDLILSRGATLDYNQMYKAFRGREPDINAMKKNMGLAPAF